MWKLKHHYMLLENINIIKCMKLYPQTFLKQMKYIYTRVSFVKTGQITNTDHVTECTVAQEDKIKVRSS